MSNTDPINELEQQARELEQNFDKNNPVKSLDGIENLLSSIEEKLDNILKALNEE